MRGGLGRVLLTAFMLLAIVPLTVVSYLGLRRVRGDMRQAAMDNVDRLAATKAAHLISWVDVQRHRLVVAREDPGFRRAVQDAHWNGACQLLSAKHRDSADLSALSLLSPDSGMTLCSVGSALAPDLGISVSASDGDGQVRAALVGYPNPEALHRAINPVGLEAGEHVFLVDERGKLLLLFGQGSDAWPAGVIDTPAVNSVLSGEQGSAFYENVFGVPVVGAYRWLPAVDAALVIEQPEATALAREDDLAAMFVGSALAVALLTTMLAAVITRQLTRPIVQLTMSAVRIANGDLDQCVDVGRRDEIGILAQAFNVMTVELRSLYTKLEQKVAERTRQLVEANRQLRYQAMQLTLSAEIGRVATSILDLDLLLDRVTTLILDSYARVYYVYYVAILLEDQFEEWVEIQASAGTTGQNLATRVAVGGKDPIGQVAADGRLRTRALGCNAVEVTVPLRIGARVIGVLDLCCSEKDVLAEADLDVLQSLGDQISVAIENARIYAAERERVARLCRLDNLRLASLGAGSRELVTELNTIIGFSRLVLKGVDGPLTEPQRADLVAIHKSGYSLLGLIDNVITLSELESGALTPDPRRVDLGALLNEVGIIARQRLVGTATEYQGAENLQVFGDISLLRQAFLELVAAAAERMSQSKVTVRASLCSSDAKRVIVHIGNGNGTRWDTFTYDAEPGVANDSDCDPQWDDEMEELSVALTLARRIIQLHNGWVHLCFAEQGLDSVAVLPLDGASRDATAPERCGSVTDL